MKKYGLSIVLAILFIASWVGQYMFQYKEYRAEQLECSTIADMSGFKDAFLSATFENWQSEFLQLLTFVILSTYLRHKGSPQSKDGQDEMKEQLNRIEEKLKKLG